MPGQRTQVAALLILVTTAPARAGAQASADSVARGVLLRELADSTLWPEGIGRGARLSRPRLVAVPVPVPRGLP
jgi:hypothetical protein